MLRAQRNLNAKSKFLSVAITLFLLVSMIPTLAFPKASNAVENEEDQVASLNDVERGVVYPGRERTQEEIEGLLDQDCIVDYFDARGVRTFYWTKLIIRQNLGFCGNHLGSAIQAIA